MRTLPVLVIALAGCTPTVSFPPDGSMWPLAPVPAWSYQARMLVTDNGDDTLAAVSLDLPTPKLLGFAPVGDIPVELEGPHHIAASPDGATVFVPLSNYVPGSGTGPHGSHGIGTVPGSLLKIRASDYVKVAEVEVDRNPGDVLLSRDGKTAYVSHYDLLRLQTQVGAGRPEADGFSSVAVVDTEKMTRPNLYPVCATGHGMALSADEKTLYVTCSQVDQLAVMNLDTHQVTRVPVGLTPNLPGQPTYAPYAVVRSPTDGTIWISCNKSGDVRVFDPKTGKMDYTRTVFVNGVAMFSAFLSDGKTLLVPHQGDDKISVVDAATSTIVASIGLPPALCLNAHVLTVVDDKTGYLVCEGDHIKIPGTLVAIDLQARTPLGYATVGMFPDGMVRLPPAP